MACSYCYGKIPTDKTLIDWAIETQDRGAGEILFTSMDIMTELRMGLLIIY